MEFYVDLQEGFDSLAVAVGLTPGAQANASHACETHQRHFVRQEKPTSKKICKDLSARSSGSLSPPEQPARLN
ncbi:MAG: hypothetical protein ACJ8EF_22470 [Bradyrhizobium sp.]